MRSVTVLITFPVTCSSLSLITFGHISHLVLVFLSWSVTKQMPVGVIKVSTYFHFWLISAKIHFLTISRKNIAFQRCIQNPIKRLWWSFFCKNKGLKVKQLKNIFAEKLHLQTFHWILNTPQYSNVFPAVFLNQLITLWVFN